MKYFAQKIGENEGEAVFYLQEPSDEIQPERKAPVLVIVSGGAYMWTSDREGEPVATEYAQQLRKYKVPFELHIYQNGEHGCALGDERTDSLPDHSQINMQAATWVNLSAGWLKQIFS